MATNGKSQIILESSIVIIITTLIGILMMELVALKYIIGILWSIPLVILIKKHNLHIGLLVILASVTLMAIKGLTTDYLLFLLQYGPIVLLIGYFLYNKFPAAKSLMIILALGIVINGTLILVTIDQTKVQLNDLQNKMQINVQDTMLKFKDAGILSNYEKLGIEQTEVENELNYSNVLIRQLILLIPGIIIINYLISVVLIYLLARRFIVDDKPPLPKFSTWHVPWQFIWLIIIGLGLTLIGDYYRVKLLMYLGLNLALVITPFFIIISFSVISYYYLKWKLTFFSKVLLILLFITSPKFIFILILLLGIFDPYFDFRGIEGNKESVSGGFDR